MSYCFGCRGKVDGEGYCLDTNKFGYRCFSCGSKGHVSRDYVSKGAWSYLSQCPQCGESEVYTGNMENVKGIASGAFSEMGARQFGW